MSGLRDGTRLVVTGNPTAEEVAAVVVALDQVLAAERPVRAQRSAWQFAGRLEAITGRPVERREDLIRP